MKKVIFWHTYLVNDYKLIVQDQITKLITSGLYENVDTIFVGISANSELEIEWFKNIVSHYNKCVPIVLVDKDGEKPTMRLLVNYIKENDCYVLYFHTKCVSNTGYNNTLWRWSQDYSMIYRWKECIDILDYGMDAVGCNLRKDTHIGYHPHFSGGYWWSTSKYVRTLNEAYLYDKTILGGSNALTVEFFIGSNPNEKLFSIFDCGSPIHAPSTVESLITEYIK